MRSWLLPIPPVLRRLAFTFNPHFTSQLPSMTPVIFLIICCLIVIAASMIGGIVLAAMRVTHTQLQLFVSMIAGLMLGVAMLHLLPMAVQFIPDSRWAFLTALLGLLVMFFLIRTFHFHEHSVIETPESAEESEREHGCDHQDHHHSHQSNVVTQASLKSHAGWIGLATGLSIHSLLDGFALAAAINSGDGHSIEWGGLGILLAVALHKPLDSMMITSMLIARGSSRKIILAANFAFALTCPIGAVMLWMGIDQASHLQAWVLGVSLAFSAGVFLCISLGDLLPELHFHTHDRFKLSIALMVGVALAVAIENIPGHSHQSPPPHNVEQSATE